MRFGKRQFCYFLLIFGIIFSVRQHTALANYNESVDIETIISQMTLEQKVAQMIFPGIRSGVDSGVTVIDQDLKNFFRKYAFGGVVLFGGNIVTVEQTMMLIDDIQRATLEGGAAGKLIITADQEGGFITRLPYGTQMPGNMALAATGDPMNAEQAAAIMAEELSVLGINADLAPVMDVNNNPSNPIIGIRSFSDNPELVSSYGISYIRGLHSEGVMSVIKHFPGHGDTDVDSHVGLPFINKTAEELKQMELVPFMNALPYTDMVMAAHIQFPLIETETWYSSKQGVFLTLPATLSEKIITGLLRNELGFEGPITTDALQMGAIEKYFTPLEAANLAVNAGVDILMVPIDLYDFGSFYEMELYIHGIVDMVKNGVIPEEKINDSVYRILKLKSDYGLLENDLPAVNDDSIRLAMEEVGSVANHDMEWEIAGKAVTLLKNEGNLIPLTGFEKVVFVVPYANLTRSLLFAERKMVEKGLSAFAEGSRAVILDGMLPEEAKAAVRGADVVIAVSALRNEAELDPAFWTGRQSACLDAVIEQTHADGGHFILISAQLPYDTARYPDADAVLACYNSNGMITLPGEYDVMLQYGPNVPAAIYVIFGGLNPTGKLPVDIPFITEYYSFSDKTEYPRGLGLTSYAESRNTEKTVLSPEYMDSRVYSGQTLPDPITFYRIDQQQDEDYFIPSFHR